MVSNILCNISYFSEQNAVYGFTAARADTGDENLWETINTGSIITFSKVITNIGSAYDPSNSHFTCPVKGMYVFMITMFSGDGHLATYAELSVDGKTHPTARAHGTDGIYDQGTQSVVIECNIGQKVYVQAQHAMEVYDSGADFSSFSGWLVHAVQE